MMSFFALLALFMLGICRVQGKAVFAHFMITNTENYTISDWTNDFTLARDAHIDAFALNMAYNDPINNAAISTAFTVASSVRFQLFFSFDYAGNGAWPEEEVITLINAYGSKPSYYKYDGKPFVSTFEGPDSSDDWVTIKEETGCFFMPDWSSLGAKAAMAKNVADGLFSWAAWPWGPREMNTYVDASYLQYLDGSPYMMPVSPWFYTNLPGYDKNWLWRSDDLWYDRWQEVWFVQPEFVEIISWNDYGESHYIGPIYEYALAAFDIGEAPFNYVNNMPHDGWRLFLPFVIDMYKYNTTEVTQEGLVTWFRPQPRAACDDGGTTVNTASQLEVEYLPANVVEDSIYFSALLGSEAEVSVTIGSTILDASWTYVPKGGVGIYHGSIPYTTTGEVTVTISRNGATIASVSGGSITSDCTDGYENWNAWVGSASSRDTISATPISLSDEKCVQGTGIDNFSGLCEFSCQYSYCPIGACYCKQMGPEETKPNATYVQGYPLAGEDANYGGLCSFDCNYGYCPDSACGTTSAPLSTPTSSPFTPPACTSGEGEGNLAGLCSYACNFGYCPINACTCTSTGVLNEPPAADPSITAIPAASVDYSLYNGLCQFACSRGYCPDGACMLQPDSENPGSSNETVAYLGGDVWDSHNASCPYPCVVVLPSITFPSPTVLYPPPYVTNGDVEWTTATVVTGPGGSISTSTATSRVVEPITIPIPPVTIGHMDWWNIHIPSAGPDPTTVYPMPRIPIPPVTVPDDPNPLAQPSVTHEPKNRTFLIPPWPWNKHPYGPDGGDDVDPQLPKPTPVVVSNGPTSPKCATGQCGTLCDSTLDIFCHCTYGCSGSGFADTGDDNPPPNPDANDHLEENPQDNPNDDDPNEGDQPTSTTSCSRSTVTDAWVSCTTMGSTSTSCTTTRTLVEIGCSVTASTTTTGVDTCPTLDPNDGYDQGEDGGALDDSVISSISAGWTGLGPVFGFTTTAASSSRTTSTTRTAPVTTTTSSPTVPQYPSTFEIFLEGSSEGWQWLGVDLRYDQGNNAQFICNGGTAIVYGPIKAVNPSSDSDFVYPAQELGPFNLNGYTGCKYSSMSDTIPGTVTCDNNIHIDCTGVNEAGTSSDDPTLVCGKDNIYLQLSCSYT